MSVNIDLALSVTQLRDSKEAERILNALEELMRDEGIHNEVPLTVAEVGEEFQVFGGTDYPLIITRFYLWQPDFESRVNGVVRDVAPSAKVLIEWGYPDDED